MMERSNLLPQLRVSNTTAFFFLYLNTLEIQYTQIYNQSNAIRELL